MPTHYFAIGTTLASMVNIETYISSPPHVIPTGVLPISGGVSRQVLSGKWRRDGAQTNAALQWDYPIDRAEFNAFIYAVWGSFAVESAVVYITSLSDDGNYSPFLCSAKKPHIEEDYKLSEGGFIRELSVKLSSPMLQSVTKTTSYTITSSDRLVYGNTAGGSFTLTLPAAAGVIPHTIYGVEKTSASNTLTIQRAGSDTVNAETSIALTANRGRYDLISDGVSAWVSV